MGNLCRGGDASTDEDAQNKHLERMLEEEKIKAALDFKILLLGAGESGKSTVVKQLRNIYLGKSAISQSEIESYKAVLHTNTVQSVKVLIKACDTLGIDRSSISDDCGYISKFDETQQLSQDDAVLVARLWKSEPIQAAFARKSEVYCPDAAPYYFDNIARFVEAGFTPTEEDIVMARIRTTGMFMTAFDTPPVHWRVVDVGGQRSERKKWIRFFDDVEAILFVVNLAGFNQVLFEDQKKNRMMEAMELFESIVNKEAFKDTPFFLFLNKKDLFEVELRKNDITVSFPAFYGDKESTQEQLDHIANEFQQRMPDGMELAACNFIAARVKRDVRYAFEDVKNFLIHHNQKIIDKAVKNKERLEDEPR